MIFNDILECFSNFRSTLLKMPKYLLHESSLRNTLGLLIVN